MVGKCSTSRPYPSLIFHFNKNGCALQKAQVNEIRMVTVVVTFYHLKGKGLNTSAKQLTFRSQWQVQAIYHTPDLRWK